MFGDGSYFARDVKYSDGGYAKTLPKGQKQMLVVDLLVGRSALGKMGLNEGVASAASSRGTVRTI